MRQNAKQGTGQDIPTYPRGNLLERRDADEGQHDLTHSFIIVAKRVWSIDDCQIADFHLWIGFFVKCVYYGENQSPE